MKHDYSHFNPGEISNIKYELKMRNLTTAKEHIQNYLKNYPDDILGKAYEAKLLCLEGDMNGAIEIMESYAGEKFYSKNSKSIFFSIYGDILERAKRVEESAEKFSYAFSLTDYSYAPLAIRLANIYSELKDYDKALAVLNNKEVIDNRTLIAKANILYHKGDIDKAINILENVDMPKSENSYYFQLKYYVLGLCYQTIDYFEEAEECFKKVLTAPKTDLYTYAENGLIKVLYHLHKYNEDLKLIDNHVKRGGTYKNAVYYLCNILIKKGEYDKALESINNVKNESLKYYELGELCLAKGETDEAMKYYAKSLSSKETNNFEKSILGLALCYYRKKDYRTLEYFLNVMEEHDPKLTGLSIQNLHMYLAKVNNEEIDTRCMVYSSKQIYKYNESLALDHVMRHHMNELRTKASRFKEGTDLEELFNQVREIIKNKKPIMDQFFDRYIIPYKDIGFDKDGVIDQLIVITNKDTDEIITMYPASGDKLVLDKEEEFKPKVLKKVSAIDKFRQRYGDKY